MGDVERGSDGERQKKGFVSNDLVQNSDQDQQEPANRTEQREMEAVLVSRDSIPCSDQSDSIPALSTWDSTLTISLGK